MQPIKKKVIEINGKRLTFDDFEIFYHRYLQFNNCTAYYKIENEYSYCDYLLSSGNSTVVVEHKNKYSSIKDYFNSFIEKQKYDHLKGLSQLLKAPVQFINEYNDAIVIWQIDFNKIYKSDTLPCQREQGSSNKVLKDIFYLEYKDADFVIGKKKMKRATKDELEFYLNN